VSLKARIARLADRLVPDAPQMTYLTAYVGRLKVDFAALGFRRPADEIEAIHHAGGTYSVMLRVPVEADYTDCDRFLTQEQLDFALFAHNVNILMWPPRPGL
jgi:hypothetical protein